MAFLALEPGRCTKCRLGRPCHFLGFAQKVRNISFLIEKQTKMCDNAREIIAKLVGE
ncbi:hypothetical protein [Sulfuricurvum sp.]|uniref:hypothetical protein n=1 Tax=Sulfuricurvum sp. TaxID=2025608 RepID=UPI0025DF7F9B|nr:hypothetical protein [Sulfuricurvum sp.]